jgi:hypothetical protein
LGGGANAPLAPPLAPPLVVRLSHDLSQQPKYNILELKIRGVIITREYLYDLYVVYRYKLL